MHQEEIAAGPLGIPAEYTPYEILVIASMIEREAKTDEDRPLIARVIYNRLANAVPLQIDATLLYNAPPELVDVEDIDFDALRAIDTPWNTYMHAGLAADADRQPGPGVDRSSPAPCTEPESGQRAVHRAPGRASACGCSTSSRTSKEITPSPSPRNSTPPTSSAPATPGCSIDRRPQIWGRTVSIR